MARANRYWISDSEDDSDEESRISTEPDLSNWNEEEPDTPTGTTVLYYARTMSDRGPVAMVGPYDNVFSLIRAVRHFRRDLIEMGERLETYTVWHGYHGTYGLRIRRPTCG